MAEENTKVKINLLFGSEANFLDSTKKPANVNGTLYLTTVDTSKSYLYFGDGTNFLNIVPKLLNVVNGGTGRDTLTEGYALIGNGQKQVALRPITDNVQQVSGITPSSNLITANTLKNWDGADHTGTSVISKLGTIEKGVWNASTIVVGYGGTGATTFTKYGVLYGDGVSPLQATAAGTKGQILSVSANNSAPAFETPEIEWVSGSTAGPVVKLTLGGTPYTSTIPSASDSVSGVVTTGAQTFEGNKTFNGAIISTTIHPTSNGNYTNGTGNNPWYQVISKELQVLDSNKHIVGTFKSTTTGTTAANGVATLEIGNASAEKTAGNAKGQIILRSVSSTGVTLAAESGADAQATFPKHGGYVTMSPATMSDPTTETGYRLAFYTTNAKVINSNTGLTVKVKKAASATSAAGSIDMILGHTDSSNAINNKVGSLTMHAGYGETFTVTPNPAQVVETTTNITAYKLYLPVPTATSGVGELLFHNQGESIGSEVRPIYLTTTGKPAAITTMAVNYGGTGATSFTTNGVLYGQNTGAVKATAAGSYGQVLSVTSAGVPSFASPTWSWSGGSNEGPILKLSLHSKEWATAAIPSATSSASGIVTTTTQSFSGIKTFENTTDTTATTNGAVIVKGGVGIGSSLRVGGSAYITEDCAVTRDLFVHGGDIYFGSSSTTRSHMIYTNDANLGDTITIEFDD